MLVCSSESRAELFGGIDFPQGASSFADRVVSVTAGSPAPTGLLFTRPVDALGPPNHPGGNEQPGAFSLGSGGSIVLEFTNNLLSGSDSPTADLHVFEVGSDVEDTYVEISPDGVAWSPIGKVTGSISSIDIDAFGFTSTHQFRYVRLTDDPLEGQTSGDSVGADIDTVGAIASSAVDDDPVLTIRSAGNSGYADLSVLQEALAHWKLNEASGTVAVNSGSLGSSANGSYGNTTYLDAAGLRAGSEDSAMRFAFKSIQGRMVVTGFAMPTNAVTVSFLIRGQDDGESFFFGYGSAASSNEFTMGTDSGSFRGIIRGNIQNFPGVDVLDGTVHHVALTWDGPTGFFQIHVDGQPVASRTIAAGSSLGTGGVLALGQDLDSQTPPNYSFSAAQSLVGTLDEFAVFGRVLTLAEIESQAASALSAPSLTTEFFLEFPSAAGSTYTIGKSPDLATWDDLVTSVPGTGGLMRFAVVKEAARRFYRLE